MKTDGVRFPGNKIMQFDSLHPLQGQEPLYAEGEWTADGEVRRVAVAFGPEYGPITAEMVSKSIRKASKRGFDELVFAGFSFDGMAQATIEDDPNPELHCHMAHIRPDEMMKGLLKDTANAQIFTVSGLPRVELRKSGREFYVDMQGVDIYDPVKNVIVSATASQVAAWFLDSDYDGACFCITQAFFPNPSAWEKLSKALTGVVDADRFAALSGTKSLPFPVGKHQRAAVKVIDPRGNEVMRLLDLTGGEIRYAS
jgi:adenine-specific DNA-methyltransferase